MEAALNLIDELIAEGVEVDRLTELRELVANPSLDDLEAIIEKLASDKKTKIQLIRRGKGLIKKIMGK